MLGEAVRIEPTLFVAASEVAAPNFPDEVATVLAVIGAY